VWNAFCFPVYHFSIVKKIKEFVRKSLICEHERVPFRNSQLLLRTGIISRPILSSPTSGLNQFDPDNEHVSLRGSYISNIQDVPTGKPAGANSQRTGQFNCINTSVKAFWLNLLRTIFELYIAHLLQSLFLVDYKKRMKTKKKGTTYF